MLPPQTKIFSIQRISHLALITAACIVGRLVFVFIPNIQPMSALLFLVAFSYRLSDALVSGRSVNCLHLLSPSFFFIRVEKYRSSRKTASCKLSLPFFADFFMA